MKIHSSFFLLSTQSFPPGKRSNMLQKQSPVSEVICDRIDQKRSALLRASSIMVTNVPALSDSFIEKSSFQLFRVWYTSNRSIAPITSIRNNVPFVKRLFEGGNEAMTTIGEGAEQPPNRGAQPARQKPARQKRADAQRNEQALLAAAAAVFVKS